MKHERRLRRLEEARNVKVQPMNKGMQMASPKMQLPAFPGLQMASPSPNRARQRRLKKNESSSGPGNKHEILSRLMNMETVYFNVPGIETDQRHKYLRMQPGIPFSVAGELQKVCKKVGSDDSKYDYRFRIPTERNLLSQYYTCNKFGGAGEKLPSPIELNPQHFRLNLPANAVCWFVSETPQYTCINENRE